MLALIGRRLVFALVTLSIVSVVVFTAVEMLPGDMATAYLGRDATEENLAVLREEFDLNRPAYVRFADWLANALQGDLGMSMARREAINDLIGIRLRNTLLLGISASLVGIPLAILLGVVAGLTRDRWPDIVVSMMAIFGMTLPEYVTATFLIFVFAIQLQWFPAVTTVAPDAPIMEMLPNIVLPIVTLTLVMMAHILRLVRTSMIDVMISDYVQMARLKGVPYMRVVFYHALPNAMLPTINIVALTIAWLLGGVLIIEFVFNYPGIGRLMITGIYDRDLLLVQGIAIVLAAMYVFVNLIADLLTLVLNPRLRTTGGH